MTIMHTIAIVAGYFLFSAAVGAMKAPSAGQDGRFYGWLYRFLQRLAANADRLAEARYPGLVHTEGTTLAVSSESVTTRHTDTAVVDSH